MPWSAEDLDDFLSDDMPGVVGAVIDGNPVSGHFRQPTGVAFDSVSGFKPVLRCKAADVLTVTEGAPVVINAESFTVGTKTPSRNTGWVLLELEIS